MNRKVLLVCTLALAGIVGAWFVSIWLSSAEPKQVVVGRQSGARTDVSRMNVATPQTRPVRGQGSTDVLARGDSDDLDTQTNAETSANPSPNAEVAAAKATPRALVGNNPVRASTGGSGWGMNRAPPSKALIRIDGGEIAPQNFSGHYQRVLLGKRGKADIRVEFPEDGASRQVLVRAIQGGKINGADNYAVFDLGGDKNEIAFTFESGREAGLSEIILRRGTTEEVLQFWAPTASPQYDPPALRVSVR